MVLADTLTEFAIRFYAEKKSEDFKKGNVIGNRLVFLSKRLQAIGFKWT